VALEHIGDILRNHPMASSHHGQDRSSPEPEDAAQELVCPLCHGARFVHPLLPSGKPDYSRIVPCRCTREDQQGKRQSRLQRYSNLGSLTRLTFESLLPRGRSEDDSAQQRFSRALAAARAFAENPRGWLVLTGPSGSGKTHLAAAIANHLIAQGKPAFYISTPDLLDHLRSSFGPNSEMPYDEFFEQVRNTPLLVLDDFGAHSSTPWASEKLEQLLTHRFSNQLPTVIITMVALDELEERTHRRLADPDLCQVHIIGTTRPALSTSGWGAEFELQKHMTFETFDHRRANLPLEQRQNLETAYRLAQDFACSPDGWLVFQGAHGCGKTHLAAAIVNHRYRHGKPALFVVVPDLLDHLRSTFSPESKISYDRLFESVRSTPLLVLDDLGTQTASPWAREKLYQIINHRYNARLATVITTNYTTDEIDSPIASRMVDQKLSVAFTILAPNYYSGEKRMPPRRRDR